MIHMEKVCIKVPYDATGRESLRRVIPKRSNVCRSYHSAPGKGKLSPLSNEAQHEGKCKAIVKIGVAGKRWHCVPV